MNDQDTSTETVQLTGLRASNTLQTLKPVEFNARELLPMPEINPEIWAALQKSEDNVPASISPELDPFKTYDPVNRPTLFTQPEPFETLNVSHVKDDPIWIISAILDRLETLEAKVAGLLERVEKYNVRAQHRL